MAVNRLVTQLSLATAAFAFLVLLGALFAQFVAREVFNHGLIWADELARLSFVWCSLFAASAAWSEDALHRIDLLTRNLKGSTATSISLVGYALVLAALVYLIYFGMLMAQRALDQTTSTLEISGAWLYVPLPLAAVLMLVTTISRLMRPCRRDNQPANPNP